MERSLEAILRPRTLAVIGVSAKVESLSGKLLGNLIAAGYTGTLYPVNPKARALRGIKCYPSLKAIPDPLDLAILMVPRDAALLTIDECLEVGVKAVVVITAGFREGGEAGAEVERALLARVKQAGVRMLGPNCMGVINTEPDVRMDASFSPAPARAGAVAFASHSGALGVAVLEAARDVGLGFSHFVSLGNSADLNVNDFLVAWEDDPGTRAIVLYLESMSEPARFLDLASRITRKKPIIAFKGGRTAAGQRAASSHTGALAAGDTGVEALFKQAGIIRVDTLEEMFSVALALESSPLPPGRRVALVTNAGGPAIAATDALARRGLELADLQAGTQQTLRSFLPAEASVGNPVDMLPSCTPENFRQAVALALADPGVDGVVTIAVTPPNSTPMLVAESITLALPEASKPVLSVYMTNRELFRHCRSMPGAPPVYTYPEAAVDGFGGLVRQAERVAASASGPITAPASGRLRAARRDVNGYLGPDDAFAVLEAAGISVAPYRIASDAAEALAAGRELGFPVVLKAFGEKLLHKSELGAVVVGLPDEKALGDAVVAMQQRLQAAGVASEGFLLQKMISGGREVILGVSRDPVIGPLVMAGLGGVAVEVWKDVSFRVAPISMADAGAMLGELRGVKLLGAFRGRPAGDVEAFKQAIVRLAALAAAHPELSECDVNPLLVLDDGKGCMAVDARLRIEP